MALEQLTNAGNTTLSGLMNNSSNPVTFTVASAAEFPTTGNFYVIIDDEILHVTSVSGTSFTAARAQEGTSIASHSSGVAVTYSIVKTGLNKVIAEMNHYDTLANQPAATQVGRRFQASDSDTIQVADGTNWKTFGPICGPFSTPLLTDYSSVYRTHATFTQTQTKDSIVLKDTGVGQSGENLRGIYKSWSGTTWSAKVAYRHMNTVRSGAYLSGFLLRKSSTDYEALIGTIQRSGNESQRFCGFEWNAGTSFSGTQITEFGSGLMGPDLTMLRLDKTGSNSYELLQSFDWNHWIHIANFTLANVNAPDQFGFCMNLYNPDQSFLSGDGMAVKVYHLEVA